MRLSLAARPLIKIKMGAGQRLYIGAMSRPPRIQAPGALYHVTSRGNRRERIFVDEFDYATWIGMLGEATVRFELVVHSYCLMPNHFHLVIETPQGNIASGMHYLNGKYFQFFNRKYRLTGHVSQGRYYAELVQRELYLLELARYVVHNPVRAGLVHSAEDWAWSSYRGALGMTPPPPWLTVQWMLSQFGGADEAQRTTAYRKFVEQGRGRPNPLPPVHKPGQRSRIDDPALLASLAEYFSGFADPLDAALQAYLTSSYSIRALARYLKMSPRSLMRLLRARAKQQAS
jgi:REP element-mobilizing transposase RayT/AraC-like DNA-binding protein